MGMKRAVLIGIRFLIAFAILYLLFSRIPLSNVISTLASTKLNYLIFASILTIISQLIVAYRLKFFTSIQGMSLTALQVFEINLATAFYGLFLPGGNLTGGAIRFYKLSVNDKKIAEAFASLALDRITATIALCNVGIVFWLIQVPSDSQYIIISMAAILFILILSIVILMISRRALQVSRMIDLNKVSFIASSSRKFFDTIDRFRNYSISAIVFILGISVISQILGVIVYYILALSLGIEISLFAMGWIRCVVVLISMIPISIAGLGIREGSLILLLRPFGVSDEEALALSLLVFVVNAVFIGFIGGLLEGKNYFYKNLRLNKKQKSY
jgi:glycosyltransferase 2 family protein